MTLGPGLYKSTSFMEISSGDLTLDAQGNDNAVFIFQMASTFTSSTGRKVFLMGGAKASNIFWQVRAHGTRVQMKKRKMTELHHLTVVARRRRFRHFLLRYMLIMAC
jgi:hypothetical protein